MGGQVFDMSAMVGAGRLELPWVAPHDPKSCMSANSITRPHCPLTTVYCPLAFWWAVQGSNLRPED